MKILILSRKASLYSTQRLKEAGEARGHKVRVVDYLRCYMNIASHRPRVVFQGESLEGIDAIVPRVGATHTFYGTAVVRQFEMMEVFTANSALAIARSRDKLRCLQLLARKGVGLPVTGFANSTKDVSGLLDVVGGAPVVIKLLEDVRGIGVVLAETRKAAESVIEAFRGLDANILVQEFIREIDGGDLSCFVVGEKVVAAVHRIQAPGEFRQRGGTLAKIKLTPEERSTAVRSAREMGLRVAGVNLVRSKHGPLVIDVNASPGLQGFEKTTGADVAGRIVEYLEKEAESRGTKDRIGY